MATKANIGAKITLDGEKEYRQSVSEVSKSMSSLKSELRAVSVEYEGNANSINALRAKNEIYIKQQTEQEKKLKLLRGALDDVTKVYGENSDQAQAWQTKLNNAYAELNRINKGLNDNEKYMKEAENSTDKTAKSIDQFGKKVKLAEKDTLSFGDVLKANLSGEAIIRGIETMGRALSDVARATVNVVKETAAYADNILTVSAQTGIATDTLQELSYMAELTDTSLENVTSSMAKNIRAMNSAKEGTKLYVDSYKELGVHITGTDGKLRDSESVYWEVLDALGKMTNETERDAMAMQLLGRSAQDINPLIKIGKDGMAEFSKEARDMGAVLSSDTLKGLGATDDALQRMNQQIEITKREFGLKLAPAMTDAFGKVSEKIGEVDDEFADFAGGALESVVDGFIWMVDNADLLTSGLKGITAAIITKKAADGVTMAVQAYKTLTTTTEIATGAQIAFNTASKANVIGAIASVVIGLGTAFYSYSKSSEAAAQATNKLSDETQKLVDRSKTLREEIDKKTTAYQEEADSIEANYGAVEILSDKLYDLADKENKTNSEKQQMIALVGQLNNAMPDLNMSINEHTGYLSLQKEELDKLIGSQKEYYLVKAAEDKLTDIAKEKVESELALIDLTAKKIEKEVEFNNALEKQAKYLELSNKGYVWLSKEEKAWVDSNKDARGDMLRTAEELNQITIEIDGTQKQLDGFAGKWSQIAEIIGTQTGNITDTMKTFNEKYAKALEEQTQVELGSVEDRIESINDLYEKKSDSLEKHFRTEDRAFEKSQEAQVDTVKKAQEKELTIIEKAHKKKLKLINDEYIEKLKNVDEDRYKELKAAQDIIDGIDNQQEAEDRALKLKDEAEKKSELLARVTNATTIEERMQAQEDLTDYEAELARDRLKTERELQKNILEKQKDTINDAYDAKIDALKAEEKKEEEKASLQYENDKKAIEARYNLKIEALKEEQELEKESFKDKQEENVKYLSKQKELAIKNAKETYEEDLAELKLNNALKYNEVVANEEKIKKIMQQNATNSVGNSGGITGAQIPNLWEKDRLFLGSGTKNDPAVIEYNKIETAMVNALKKTNLTVVLDKKVVGKIVEGIINDSIR